MVLTWLVSKMVYDSDSASLSSRPSFVALTWMVYVPEASLGIVNTFPVKGVQVLPPSMLV